MNEPHIELQNKAYLFLANKHAEELVNKAVIEISASISQQETRWFEQHIKTLEASKQYTNGLVSNYLKPCIAEENSVKDEDYPVGSIISVSVTCSDEEGKLPYLNSGPKANSTLNNIYLNTSDKASGQVFHWFNGKDANSSDMLKMPGVWKSRGVCGGFSNEIVGFKYYLAQRVK